MEIFKIGFITMAAALSACAGTIVIKAAGGAAYYSGQASFFSPDGRLPYGKTDSVVKREILDGGARIIETVTQPGNSPSMQPKQIVTELKRRKKTLIYAASDAGGTFSGTVTFKDGDLKSWTYNIKLKAGGAVKGSGKLDAEGIKTEKQLTGGRPMLVKEDLKTISEEEYTVALNLMKPQGWE
ncbi:MAG TPA: hypothetical protein DEQ38_00040 [Elusimicrobia bacterium]|nr:MAG: hypothetical protein A2089_04520 [Elusimicrobia bacterium GWD2_63_28]HCC46503.1 hypothetical protein [Elusimicrobiota bacterium]